MQVDDFHGLWVLQPFDVTIPTNIPDKLPMYIVLYGLREFFFRTKTCWAVRVRNKFVPVSNE